MMAMTGDIKERNVPRLTNSRVIVLLLLTVLGGTNCLWDRDSHQHASDPLLGATIVEKIGERVPGLDGLIASDTLRERLIFVSGFPFQTWEWHDHQWSRKDPLHTPPELNWFDICYFPEMAAVLLLGNEKYISSVESPVPQLWSYDGQDWRQETMSGGPLTGGGRLVHDPVHGRVLYTGGCNPGFVPQSGSCDRQDFRVWSFDGIRWEVLPDNQALDKPFQHISLVDDADRDCLVLCGEYWISEHWSNVQTWEYHTTGWIMTSSESGLICPLVHDQINHRVVGICGTDLSYRGDHTIVYHYTGTTWEEAERTNGFAATGSATYNASDQAIYTFRASELMQYTPSMGWATASPRNAPAQFVDGLAAYSTTLGTVVMVIRSLFFDSRRETWSWDGRDLTLLDDTSFPFAYDTRGCLLEDPVRQRMLSFQPYWNNVSHEYELGTFVFEDGNWSMLDISGPRPINLSPLDAVVQHGNGQILVVGIKESFDQTPGMETWEFRNDCWALLTTSESPSMRSGSVLVYDEDRLVSILFGGQHELDYCLNDTWLFNGENWREICQTQAPLFRDSAAMTYFSEIKRTILIGGRCHGSIYSDAWEFDASNWRPIAYSGPRIKRYGSAVAYDPVRNVMVIAGGANGPEICGSLYELSFP